MKFNTSVIPPTHQGHGFEPQEVPTRGHFLPHSHTNVLDADAEVVRLIVAGFIGDSHARCEALPMDNWWIMTSDTEKTNNSMK